MKVVRDQLCDAESQVKCVQMIETWDRVTGLYKVFKLCDLGSGRFKRAKDTEFLREMERAKENPRMMAVLPLPAVEQELVIKIEDAVRSSQPTPPSLRSSDCAVK